MSTALTAYDRSSLNERATYAKTLADAADLIPRGLFDKQTGRPSPAKILLVMETGAMLGLHPMASLQGINVIEGKATISPQLMTGLIRAAGHRLLIEKRGSIAEGTYSATVTATRKDNGDVFTDTWDLDRAVRAGLCTLVRDQNTGKFSTRARSKSGEALPWEKYPELLCVWRAVGVVGREGFDDVLKGIAYMPEELGEVVDESGDAVDVEPEPSEDWEASILAADSKEAVKEIADRAKELGEFTDRVRTLALTRYGMFNRGEEPRDEPTADPAPDAAPAAERDEAYPSEEEIAAIDAQRSAEAAQS